MSLKPKEFIQSVIFGIIPIAFMAMYGHAIWKTWFAVQSVPGFTLGFITVATGASGVVVGIFALIFGIKVPASQKNNTSAQTAKPESTVAAIYGSFVSPHSEATTKRSIGWFYIAAYLVVGGLATTVWVVQSGDGTPANPGVVPEFLVTFANTFWGAVLAVATKTGGDLFGTTPTE